MGRRGLTAWCMARVHAYRRATRRRGVCRFAPSCSDYALDALATKRLPVALVSIAGRLVRCNPMARRVTPDPVARAHAHGPRPNAVRTLAALLVLGGATVLLTAGTAASDDITGGCTGTINGRPAATLTRDDPLVVGEGGTLSVEGTVPEEFAAQNPQSLTTVEVEILADLVGVTTEQHVSNGPTYTGETVEVDDYLRYGAGLYQVKVVNRGEGWSCAYTGYLELDENPLGTPIGQAAAVGVAGGAAGVVLAKGARRRPSRDWVDQLVDDHDKAERDDHLRRERVDDPAVDMVEEAGYAPVGPPCCVAALALPLPAMPLFGAGGGAAAPDGHRSRVVWSRVVFKRGHPVWGGLAGLAFGVGASVLLWQYAVWLLSIWTLVAVPVAIALLAALYSWYGRRYRVRVVVRDAAPPTPS